MLVLLFTMLLAAPAAAFELTLVLSQNDGAHAKFAEALRAELEVTAHRLTDGGSVEDGVGDEGLAAADLVVASGIAAAAAVVERGVAPTLAVLITRSQYQDLRRQYPDAALSAIVLDQPPERQLALLRAVLPHGRTIGVLFGPQTQVHADDFDDAAARAGLDLVGKAVSGASDLMPALKQALESADALIALADPLLSTSAAARSLLLSSYRYRRPVVAYSQAYVDAGALAAVFSRPGDIARDVVDWLHEMRDDARHAPQVRAPRHFDIAINHQVARALNLDVADAATVMARLREESRR